MLQLVALQLWECDNLTLRALRESWWLAVDLWKGKRKCKTTLPGKLVVRRM